MQLRLCWKIDFRLGDNEDQVSHFWRKELGIWNGGKPSFPLTKFYNADPGVGQ